MRPSPVPDFPTCQGHWWPQMDAAAGFDFFQDIGPNYLGGLLDNAARVAIHMGHRIGALVVFLVVGSLAIRLVASSEGKPLGIVAARVARRADLPRHRERRIDAAAAGCDRPQRNWRALVARGHYSKLPLLPI